MIGQETSGCYPVIFLDDVTMVNHFAAKRDPGHCNYFRGSNVIGQETAGRRHPITFLEDVSTLKHLAICNAMVLHSPVGDSLKYSIQIF